MKFSITKFVPDNLLPHSFVVVQATILFLISFVSNISAVTDQNFPATQWNSFLGGSSGVAGLEDSNTAIAVDNSGNVYVTGISYINWGSPVNAHSNSGESYDIIVAKLNSNGVLQWNTFLGGVGNVDSGGNDYGFGIAVDESNNIYVTGASESTWGTPVNDFSGGAGDTFVAKLDNDGNLLWNTFLGGVSSDPLGMRDDEAYDIKLDSVGNIYVAGISFASWGTPVNGFASGGSDAYVAKLNNNGALQWNTFLGGSVYDSSFGFGDAAYAIELDEYSNIYVVGTSSGTWGTPVNAFAGVQDIFAAKLNSSGTLQWNTFMGSTLDDFGFDIALDSEMNVYLSGTSFAPWGTPVETWPGGAGNAHIIAKLNSSGMIQWHTFVGGAGHQLGSRLALDAGNNVYITGDSQTTWNIPQEILPGGTDAFVAQLDNDGFLLWTTFLGGSGIDVGYGIVHKGNSLYIAGDSSASWGTPVDEFEGSHDGFVAKLLNIRPLNVSLKGRGNGTVISNPAGISCPDTCGEQYDFGTDVTLMAIPAVGSSFKGWSGDCVGQEAACSITVDSVKNITAEFYSFPWPILLPAITKTQPQNK